MPATNPAPDGYIFPGGGGSITRSRRRRPCRCGALLRRVRSDRVVRVCGACGIAVWVGTTILQEHEPFRRNPSDHKLRKLKHTQKRIPTNPSYRRIREHQFDPKVGINRLNESGQSSPVREHQYRVDEKYSAGIIPSNYGSSARNQMLFVSA